ncbi:MAG TPA: xanthine dehydrogenase family protein molybdopterin-binding subunit [Acidimicrobiia bacterium]|nr:xanthine dehydrogenase family protein molybdopterin-binding subunit [Acidimicrobiia bacterium]
MTGQRAPFGGRFVGASVLRREDPRLLSGAGTFVDDVVLPGLLHVAFFRSEMARANILQLDVSAARALTGVRAVLTAADLNEGAGPMKPTLFPAGAPSAPLRPLAVDDVRFVGDPIALVVAETRAIAEDACDLIDVEYEPLPPVVDYEAAIDDTEHIVHPELGTNIAAEISAAPDPELDRIFAAAPHVVTRTFRQHRYICVPMETRGIVVSWDRAEHSLAVWISHQNPHDVRAVLARALHVPENRVRVVQRDVGGGFGQKAFLGREEICVALAAKCTRSSLKWIEDRRENLVAGGSARSERATVTMAFDDDGHILGVDVDHLDEAGAYPIGGTMSAAGGVYMMFSGPYRMPKVRFRSRTAWTNVVGRIAYRGPWMMETLAREQMMDIAAAELGMDPIELRRRNVLAGGDLPYSTPSGIVLDAITPADTLEQAAAVLDYAGFRAAQAEARAEGRYLGVGFSLYVERGGLAYGVMGSEVATVRIEPDGTVYVLMGSGNHGQSLETTMPQVVAEHLGVDVDDVLLVQGDTMASPFGAGTGGSRSAVVGGTVARLAALAVRDQVLQVAGHLLEASPDDLEIDHGRIHVRGTPHISTTVRDVAQRAYTERLLLPPDVSPGLEATERFTGPEYTWSNACHVCTCEVDVTTGRVRVDRFLVSEDCGVIINPMVVDGQIAGGAVQGIGGVLYEHMAFDDRGNPLASTFLDYLVPTSAEVPLLECSHIETPSALPGGHKGMGEGGAIGSPAAVMNAIADALAPLGVRPTDQPLGPNELLHLLLARSRASV